MLKVKLDIVKMYDVYVKEVRSILELAVPVWHPALTLKQTDDIERIQKVSFKIILQDKYVSYKRSCEVFSTQTLKQRREKLCLKFAIKNLKSDRTLFKKLNKPAHLRSKTDIVQEYKCNYDRLQKSSLPYMAKMLNNPHRNKK